MPFGGSMLGIVYFAGIKVVGYSMAGLYVSRKEQIARPPALAFGGTRAVVGVAVGIAYATALGSLNVSHQELMFYAGLLPVRALEWAAVLWLFYRGQEWLRARRWRYIVLGMGWSYMLDLPAVLAAFVIPGGFWIC